MSMPPPGTTVVVPVQSAWFSKINWTQGIAFASTAITLVFGQTYAIPAEVQLAIVAGIQGVQSIATWVMKTFFTTTVTPSSAAK